jgi:hypothetical protein
MRILLFPLWPILNNQILKLAASTELGQLVSVLCIMVQNHVIKSHENENESTLSKRMNLFPCSVNVCSQFVLKSRAQIEVDSAVINPVARPPIYLIVGYAHRLNLTVAFRSSVNKAHVRAFLLSLFDESNILKSPTQKMPIRKRLIQLIEE